VIAPDKSAGQYFNLPDFIAAAFGGFAVPLVTHAARTTGTHAPAAYCDDDSQAFDQSPAAVEVDTVSHRRPSMRRTKPCSRKTSPSRT
jgi:hypothetical protein